MGLEDIHPDILQNIEFAITNIYREHGELRDLDVIKGLEALTSHYQRLAQGREPGEPELPELSLAVFEAVKGVLVMRSATENEPEQEKQVVKQRPTFSRALRKTTQEEIFLACLRKIQKSAKRWNRERGERGYLDFVSYYVR